MLREALPNIKELKLSPLDFLPQQDLLEKIVGLAIEGVPSHLKGHVGQELSMLYEQLSKANMEDVRVVVFGGGTGLANIIGGGSRRATWAEEPFTGLKEAFPNTKSVVCVTDDGGSTGELLKDLPLIALGDIRHVLLSSVQKTRLQSLYRLSDQEAYHVASLLARIFNHRTTVMQDDVFCELSEIAQLGQLPTDLKDYIKSVYHHLLTDERLKRVLSRSHCLGNLLIVAAIYQELDSDFDLLSPASTQSIHDAVQHALQKMGDFLGVAKSGVLPCTSTPAQLRVLYTNGVEVCGESKMSTSNRGYPVDSVNVDFSAEPKVYSGVLADIKNADLLLFAPGSLYSSIIPIFKVPGLADAVRENKKAIKVLISNLWVQAGETDRSIPDPSRKFLVSDMIRAYEDNIPGGTADLFSEVLCLRLDDVPASILQRYAVEGKMPIYLDRSVVKSMGYEPIECGVYSKKALEEQGVIQHDANMLANAIRALYCGTHYLSIGAQENTRTLISPSTFDYRVGLLPAKRYHQIERRINTLHVECPDIVCLRCQLLKILWKHHDIPLSHLEAFEGIVCIPPELWRRDQKWDNVFSFYDPEDKYIKIRSDQVTDEKSFETGFFIALGEALLGNYAKQKVMKDVILDGEKMGQIYHLYIHGQEERQCYFTGSELAQWLDLSRMNLMSGSTGHYTRVINGGEGFLPPGLFLGLLYAWYLDNRLASHIEYKMSLMKIARTNLIPEQKKMALKRKLMVDFLREVVFCPSR